MSLAFLTPGAVEERVMARSPMERQARRAGARFEVRDGWNVAISYGDGERVERVAFSDRSHLLKLELQAPPAALASIVAAASGEAAPLWPGMAARARRAWWCPVTPARVLVLGDPEAAGEIRAAVGEAAAGASGTVTIADLTSGLAALALVGSAAPELLARFCAIDVRPAVTPVGGFRPGSVARTPGYVLREGEQRLLALVGWALGEYLWTVVADAAERLGGGPAGVAAREPDDA